jgi:signal transduction histidine kinase
MDDFKRARLKLTGWYVLISTAMLAVFTLAAWGAEKNAFSKIEKTFVDPVARPRLTEVLERSIDNFEHDFWEKLLTLDAVLLLLATLGSFWLSGITLAPIEEMHKEQEEFAGDASHQLRTPLTIIKTELLTVKKTEKNIPKKYEEVFDSVLEEVGRMQRLVEGLLMLVRQEEGQEERLELMRIAKGVAEKVISIAREKKIQIKVEGKEVRIRAVKEGVEQVVWILVENAVKYSPEGGVVELTVEEDRSTAILKVKDEGIGISKEDSKKIFERFYRGGSGRKVKGTGLGLAIAKKLVKTHGGELSVTSEVGKGSEFSVRWPRVS